MKSIQKFEAADGTLFNTAAECENYEAHAAEVKRISLAMLPEHVATGQFRNGHGFIQLTKADVDFFDSEVAACLAKFDSEEMAKLYRASPTGIVGRYLDDADSPSYPLTSLRMCISKTFKLYGQPFFALNEA